MLIKVTQEHINHGQCNEPFSCPVALAVTAATGVMARVGSEYIKVYDHQFYKMTIPSAIAAFIEDFDNGETVEPFEFELKKSDG